MRKKSAKNSRWQEQIARKQFFIFLHTLDICLCSEFLFVCIPPLFFSIAIPFHFYSQRYSNSIPSNAIPFDCFPFDCSIPFAIPRISTAIRFKCFPFECDSFSQFVLLAVAYGRLRKPPLVKRRSSLRVLKFTDCSSCKIPGLEHKKSN